MKTFKNALIGVSVLFILIIFVSCGSKSGNTFGGGGPIAVAAKINSASVVTPTSGTIILDGSGIGTKAVINVSATGSPTPSLMADGSTSGFAGSQYTSPDLFESKTITFSASNSAGSDIKTVAINVTVDPTFAKWVGLTITGKSWKIVNSTGQSCETCAPYSTMDSCLAGYVFTYSANGIMQINYGNKAGCITGHSNPTPFWFHATDGYSGMFNTIGTIPAQPDKRIDFTSPTTATETWTISDGTIYKWYLQVTQ